MLNPIPEWSSLIVGEDPGDRIAGWIHRLLREVGRHTKEFGDEAAWALTREVISLAWRDGTGEPADSPRWRDRIEEVLLHSPFKQSARRFIVARDRVERARPEPVEGARPEPVEGDEELERVESYLERADWEVRENANMAYSLQGLNAALAGGLSRRFWLQRVYPEKIRQAHESGDLHLHDLGQLSVYCVGWDLSTLLREGFRGVPGKTEAGPPRHFRTALGQVVNFLYTLQGEAAGAQAFSSFDTLLAPFIRSDGLGDDEIRQALQEFVFNMNVPTRVGFQTPFTNVTLDLVCPGTLRDEPAIVGGEALDQPYGEYQEEMDRFNRAFFAVLGEGDARGRIHTFPIPTINLTRDFDWDSPDLAGLWAMTARYGIPYFANFIHSEIDPGEVRSMCCRLRIDHRELARRGGGLFGAHPLTGSIGVVTINLPRLAWRCADAARFRDGLGQLMELARESLERKRVFLERATDSGLYPYTRHYLRGVKDRFGQWWQNHFSTIGLVGMNEAAENLLGEGIASDRGKSFAERTLDFMRDRLRVFQEETGQLYNLEATPAEGTTYRLARLDRDRCPGIVAANDRADAPAEEPFYTNSSHLPVDEGDDLFAILDHQDSLQVRYTGGTVLHLFLGERVGDPEIVKRLVRRVAESYRLPYFSITPTFSICPEHGYLDGEVPQCGRCGRETEIYSRVVGYLRPVSQWNAGKQAEYRLRLTADPVATADRVAREPGVAG